MGHLHQGAHDLKVFHVVGLFGVDVGKGNDPFFVLVGLIAIVYAGVKTVEFVE